MAVPNTRPSSVAPSNRPFGLVLATALALSGCASSSLTEVRESEPTVDFTVNQGYQSVYRNLVDILRDCYQTNLLTAQMAVNADLYTDTRSGHMAVQVASMIRTSTWLAVEVQHVTDNTTRVRAWPGASSWAGNAKRVQVWATTDNRDCRAPPG